MRLTTRNKNRMRTRATRWRASYIREIEMLINQNPYHQVTWTWRKDGKPEVTLQQRSTAGMTARVGNMNLVWLNRTKPGRPRTYCLYEKMDSGYEWRRVIAQHPRGGWETTTYTADGSLVRLDRFDDAVELAEERVRRGRRKA